MITRHIWSIIFRHFMIKTIWMNRGRPTYLAKETNYGEWRATDYIPHEYIFTPTGRIAI